MFGYLAGSLSYTVLLIWLLISLAAFVLAIKQKNLFRKGYLSLAIVSLVLLFLGILITNSIAVTGFTAVLYAIIFSAFIVNIIGKKAIFEIINEATSNQS